MFTQTQNEFISFDQTMDCGVAAWHGGAYVVYNVSRGASALIKSHAYAIPRVNWFCIHARCDADDLLTRIHIYINLYIHNAWRAVALCTDNYCILQTIQSTDNND